MQMKQAKKYLEQRGLACPFCSSRDIEGGSMNFEASEIAQSISCHESDEQWMDVYKLVAVADAESDETSLRFQYQLSSVFCRFPHLISRQ